MKRINILIFSKQLLIKIYINANLDSVHVDVVLGGGRGGGAGCCEGGRGPLTLAHRIQVLIQVKQALRIQLIQDTVTSHSGPENIKFFYI